MYLTEGLSLLLLLGATVATHCAAHQETLIDVSTLSRNDQPELSENGLFSVPLNKTARTGAIPIDQEELIISRQCSSPFNFQTLVHITLLPR